MRKATERKQKKRETKSKQKENDQQILASRDEGPLGKMNNTANDRFHDHIIESCTAILRPAPQISFEAELHDLPPATPVSRSIYQSGLYQTTPPDAQRQ